MRSRYVLKKLINDSQLSSLYKTKYQTLKEKTLLAFERFTDSISDETFTEEVRSVHFVSVMLRKFLRHYDQDGVKISDHVLKNDEARKNISELPTTLTLTKPRRLEIDHIFQG